MTQVVDLLALAIFFGSNLFLCLLAERLRRASWAAAAGEQKQLLAVTLASIGDGVIAADTLGRVTFLNNEAERLTGWSNLEAAARPLPCVFRTINEESHLPESPVDEVLHHGMVAGLANHTILLAKDGKEIPIDILKRAFHPTGT